MGKPIKSFWAISHCLSQYRTLKYDRFTADFKGVIVEPLRQIGLRRSSLICDGVGQMTHEPCADCRDFVFRCNLFLRKTSVKTGNFFSQSQMRLIQIMITVANRIIKSPVTLAATLADVTEASAVYWSEYCWDMYALEMISLHESFGRVGKLVEIDEENEIQQRRKC